MVEAICICIRVGNQKTAVVWEGEKAAKIFRRLLATFKKHRASVGGVFIGFEMGFNTGEPSSNVTISRFTLFEYSLFWLIKIFIF